MKKICHVRLEDPPGPLVDSTIDSIFDEAIKEFSH